MRRILLAVAAALGVTVVLSSASPARSDPDGGAQIGGSVLSTLSLDLAQSGSTVRASVTTTEPRSSLSVTPLDGRSGLSARVSGPYAPLRPVFGLPLVTWNDVRASQTTTLRLRSVARKRATVLVTLSAATP